MGMTGKAELTGRHRPLCKLYQIASANCSDLNHINLLFWFIRENELKTFLTCYNCILFLLFDNCLFSKIVHILR